MAVPVDNKMAAREIAASLVPMRAVTRGAGHCFFGYYDKQQWDVSGRYLLGMRSTFADRPVRADDTLEIGMIDTHDDDRWIGLAQTRAWCWQQGCMLQWLPGSRNCVVFNDRDGNAFVSVFLNIQSGRSRTLPLPVYTVSNDGKTALSLNFSRNALTRRGYGYVGVGNDRVDHPHPPDDGVRRIDLETGRHQLIVSLDRLARTRPDPSMDGCVHWVNHLLFAPNDQRFVFLHRWGRPGGKFRTRMYTAAIDGSELHQCPIEDASHFIWFDADRILTWDERPSGQPAYYLCRDRSDELQPVGAGVLKQDGHVTVSPAGRWLLTDEYPDERGYRPLILFHLEDQRRVDVCRLHSPMPERAELRCDPHPRWDRRGAQVCVDSIHEGTRRMYVLDVSSLIDNCKHAGSPA